MPRYFFDVTDRDAVQHDTDGTDCGTSDAMRREALTTLGHMARDVFSRDGNRHDLHMDVRDGDGRIIFTACVALTARWLD